MSNHNHSQIRDLLKNTSPQIPPPFVPKYFYFAPSEVALAPRSFLA